MTHGSVASRLGRGAAPVRSRAAAARQRRSPRRAFTLLEVMLVLALIAIISAFVFMSLKQPLARQRLRSAVDEVRSDWCVARVDAMQSGHTYAFRYQVRGNRFHVGPQDNPPEGDAPPASPQQASSGNASSDGPLPPCRDGKLPAGVRFLAKESDRSSLGDEPDTSSADPGGRWSEPIYFYADGTTSDAQLTVASDKHSAVQLQLRGITGTATVDDFDSEKEQ
jgi:prepilin-type N-terminal cleavage/methylation domain-containing protein